ncbi:F0F1 ATP synthase subunit A [Candidatus Uhrbacteria bacterium]|nr:F0F1 ATP synthase subunit A [Candidatus Uhrbacteria bacterium]
MNISIAAESIAHIGTFPVTNSMLVGWVMSVVLIAVGWLAARGASLKPRGIHNAFEAILDLLLKMIDGVTKDRAQSRKFFPLIATIFLFVLAVNWAGLLPGMGGAIGVLEEHDGKPVIISFIRATSADLNFTLALAIISVITVQVVGVMSIGVVKYMGKFLNFTSPINFFVGILEIVSEAAKLVSFSFRLFGNIFAGEVLLTVMSFLVPYIIPLPFLALEVFVGFIQALVFAMLTLVFLKMSMEEAHH